MLNWNMNRLNLENIGYLFNSCSKLKYIKMNSEFLVNENDKDDIYNYCDFLQYDYNNYNYLDVNIDNNNDNNAEKKYSFYLFDSFDSFNENEIFEGLPKIGTFI